METVIIIIAIILIIIAFFIGQKVAVHPDIISNQELLKERQELEIKINTEKEQIKTFKEEKERLNTQYQEMQQYVLDAEDNAEKIYNIKMNQLEEKYKQQKKISQEEYEKKQAQYEKDVEKTKEELESLKATKIAAIEAARKERLVNQKQEDYCLQIPIEEQNDVNILKSVRNRITKPRAISSVIWSAYFQPLAKKQFPQILGATEVCGIYKITNQQTGECYIGQAKDIRKRWNDHCRAGSGIDTPQGNKLYKAMQEYGLENFSFELLEQCKPEELNQKEKYFIGLYASDSLGYNGNKGVG